MLLIVQTFPTLFPKMSNTPQNLALNNSKGLDAILRGSNSSITPKKKVYKYTLQEKARIVTDFYSCDDYKGKTKEWAQRYVVDKNFFKKAKGTLEKVHLIRDNRNLLAIHNQPEQKFNVQSKTIGKGTPVAYPLQEQWLYTRLLHLEAHDIPATTTLLGAMVLARFPDLKALYDGQHSKLMQWMYRWQKRYNVVARRVTHSHGADEENIAIVQANFVNSVKFNLTQKVNYIVLNIPK